MIEYVFPTPIYVNTVDNLNKIQLEIGNVIEQVEFSGITDWGKTHLISGGDFADCVITKFNLTSFRKELDKHLKNYCKEIDFFKDSEYSLHSWFVKFEKGQFAHIHTHNYADISGVYYYNTNENDGQIFFETPISGAEASKWCNNKLMWRWGHKPRKGKLLLFPGWLRHGVTMNETDNIRIGMAFNIYFKK